MTFEELNSMCVAIETLNITFDYFGRNLSLMVKPAYGYKDSINRKIFRFTFNDCIFFCCSNTSNLAGQEWTEFNSWGKDRKRIDLFKNFLQKTKNAASLNFPFPFHRIDLNDNDQYDFYFFENVWGDAIWVISSSTTIDDVTDTAAA